MTIVVTVCMVILGAAALCTLARITMGPTMLDRTIALDVLLSVCMGGIAIEAAWHERTFTLPLLLVLALLGFTGSVSVARYTSGAGDIEAERQ